MGGTKRKNNRSEPQNIKRWRSEIESLTGQDNIRETKRRGMKQLTRKEKRKEGRQLRKMRRSAFQQHNALPTRESLDGERSARFTAIEKKRKTREKNQKDREHRKERLMAVNEEKEQQQKVFEDETAEDDKTIKQLEKQMKITKRKSKSLPQSFQNDGLNFILDVLDAENLNTVIEDDDNDDLTAPILASDSEDDVEGMETGESESSEIDDTIPEITSRESLNVKGILRKGDSSESGMKKVQFGEADKNESSVKVPTPKNEMDILALIRKSIDEVKSERKSKFVNEGQPLRDDEDGDSEGDFTVGDDSNDESDAKSDDQEIYEDGQNQDANSDSSDEMAEGTDNYAGGNEFEENEESIIDEKDDSEPETPEYKEDIYGRIIDKQGKVMTKKTTGAYVPPGKRLEMASSQDAKKKLELQRLKKRLKGLINRLSESNIQPISTQIEEMFRSQSRAELSELITANIMEACVSTTLIPERLISEQMMLLAILQGKIGNEVGAVFLQTVVEKFNTLYNQEGKPNEGKEMHNMLVMLAHMYNFKMFHSTLMFDILNKLMNSFQERDIQLLLVLLKNVGFTLRKDNPVMLKEIILKMQDKAGSLDTKQFADESRVKFMLEVLMAIRNNNMRKIPNYDPTHVEHLRKVLRNYTQVATAETQLHINLDDLLNVDARGRWWLVGSAWTGRALANADVEEKTDTSMTNMFSDHILELARQQRMNTDIRRNIFCIIMTSEDFADAFEKLLRLNLKNQQEREIINVMVDICLQEKAPNPFYAHLIQKFCEFHRRFQMTAQFNFWDHLKILSELTSTNMQNLAALMSHLIATKAISISVFKVVEFSELDKHKLHLIRRILRTLLMEHQEHVVTEVFSRVATFPKLAVLRESLRIFMKHFLLRHAKGSEQRAVLEERIEVAERALGSADSSMQL